MRLYKFELAGTTTFRSRSGLWVTGAGTGDGFLTLTTVSAKGFAVNQAVYGCQEVNPESAGERRFVLVKAAEADAEESEAYAVVLLRGQTACSCDAGRMGYRSFQCKHGASLAHLLAAGQLPRRVLSGA